MHDPNNLQVKKALSQSIDKILAELTQVTGNRPILHCDIFCASNQNSRNRGNNLLLYLLAGKILAIIDEYYHLDLTHKILFNILLSTPNIYKIIEDHQYTFRCNRQARYSMQWDSTLF